MNADAFSGKVNMDANKTGTVTKYVRMIPGALIALFLVIFVFNLVRVNATQDVDDAVLTENIEMVAQLQTGDAEAIEKEVSKLEVKEKLSASKASKAMYKKLFKKTVVVGDSLTEGLLSYGWLSKKNVYSIVGASVISSRELMKKAAKKKPENAFFAFGMNDLIMYRKDPEGFIKEYDKQLKYFHKKSPKTKIFISGISAPSKDAIKRQKSLGKYKKFNQNLKKFAKKNGYGYVKVSDILENNKNLYGGDGIHAKSAYYPHWLNRMAEAAELID